MHEANKTKEQLIEELTKAIAEQRRTAEALRRSEEQYRSVVDHIGIGVAVISRNVDSISPPKKSPSRWKQSTAGSWSRCSRRSLLHRREFVKSVGLSLMP